MFALGSNSRQRSQSQSQPQYRLQEYYLPSTLPPHLSLQFQDSVPRPFTGEHNRTDLYPQPSEHSPHLYPNSERNIGGLEYDNRDSLATFNQSYDRRASSSTDSHASPHIPYHNHQQPDSERLDFAGPAHLKRIQTPNILDNISLTPYRQSFSPELRSAPMGSTSERSGDSEFWPGGSGQAPSQEHPKPRKVRREKPRIELAPDQPPTTQGRPRARVYVACLQCRTRKIRCDGAKPVCHNCGRRTNAKSECNYDPIPKRRGPDKTPGARQRMAREVTNEVDKTGLPSRRRRRGRVNSTSDSNRISHQQSQVRQDIPPVRGSDTLSTIALALSPETPSSHSGSTTGEFVPVLHYGRSYPPECECHHLAECPGLPDAGGLSSGRKPVSSITPYPTYDMSSIISPYVDTSPGYITEVDENNQEQQSSTPDIGSEPSLTFSRKIWWDSLLSLYLSPTSKHLQVLSASQRESAAQSITTDLRFLFRASNYWFSFFHIPSFFGKFCDPLKRERIQPSLVLALLALATFWQSSEVGYGKEGRERALRFRDEAQAAMDASFNAGWIDETLAQAAWLLSLFEVCAHPRHSSERSTSSMFMLDSIIRSLSLTLVDADDPDATMFSPGMVPIVTSPKQCTMWFPDEPPSRASPECENGCSCQQITLGEHWPSAVEHAPLWGVTPAWDDSWTAGEIRKESCRRLCWSSMILAASHSSYATAHCSQSLDLFISDPSNYALLFSGESIARSPTLSRHSSKDTTWALQDRAFLLWHGCIRMRNNNHATEDDKAQFAVKVWLEADRLEVALNKHTCTIERAFLFQAREYIFNTRMFVSYEFQRYVPLVTANVSGLFHRDKAEEWLTHQATVAQRFMYGLHTITGHSTSLLARRPFFVFWFMGQINRALSLWQCDKTLTVALDVCKALISAIDYLTALWPCPEQRHRYESLREKVVNTCFVVGVEPPRPCDLSLPPSSPEALV